MSFPNAGNGHLYDGTQVEEYFNTLFRHVDWEPGQVFSLLGIGEKGTEQEGKFRDRQIIPPAFVGSCHAHLKRWADHHVAAFVVPAVLHATALEKGDVTLDKVAHFTAIILDLDSGDIGARSSFAVSRLGVPTMTIASGGVTSDGEVKRHLYWLLNEPSDEIERIAALRKLLAAKVGGDQSFGRATQVIRIPGTVHAKNGVAALCAIIGREDADYNLDDLADIIENMEPMPGVELATVAPALPFTAGGMMDFSPRTDTAMVAMSRDVLEGGTDLTRWSEYSKVAGFNISQVRLGLMAPEAAYTATNGWALVHMIPAWPQARIDQEFQALVNKDVEHHGPFPQSLSARAEGVAAGGGITPTQATWRIGSMIPPRPWLLGRWLQRGIVTAVVSPGGVGKSSLMAAIMLSMASGNQFLGKTIYGGPLRVWYWNLEDNGDNLDRARTAASMYHGVTEAACGGRMYVDSGPEGAELCTAIEDRSGFTIIVPVMENIIAAIKAMGLDVLAVDPFVSSHAVNENDNNKIDAVAKWWSRVAIAANCAIVLVHHSAKTRGEAVTAESSRGASSLNNAARVTLVLNRMTADQADRWQIEFGKESRFFSVADDKHNLAPAETADWFELKSVDLGNGNDVYEGDSVGVVTRWHPPKVMDGVSVDTLAQVQRVLAHGGPWWANINTKDSWAGEVVAKIMRLDAAEPAMRSKIDGILKTWVTSGALQKVQRDKNGRDSPALIPGKMAISYAIHPDLEGEDA